MEQNLPIVLGTCYHSLEKYKRISSKLRTKFENNLEVTKDKVKGRGVVTTVPRVKGDFIWEYVRVLISFERRPRRKSLTILKTLVLAATCITLTHSLVRPTFFDMGGTYFQKIITHILNEL